MQVNYHPTTATPHRAPLGSDMNHLYLSPSQQQISRPGVFSRRNERIDWRRIGMKTKCKKNPMHYVF